MPTTKCREQKLVPFCAFPVPRSSSQDVPCQFEFHSWHAVRVHHCTHLTLHLVAYTRSDVGCKGPLDFNAQECADCSCYNSVCAYADGWSGDHCQIPFLTSLVSRLGGLSYHLRHHIIISGWGDEATIQVPSQYHVTTSALLSATIIA